jgi:hypothetical protein
MKFRNLDEDFAVHRSVEFHRIGVATLLLAGALMGAAAIGGAKPAAAGWFSPPRGTWCALESTGLNDCLYFSYQQCLATLSGIGGTCQPNLQAPPSYYPPPPRHAKKAGQRRHAAYPPSYPPGYMPPPPPY